MTMPFVRFGLIVTGDGEAQFLPKLFRSLMAAGRCTFEVIRKSGQIRPRSSVPPPIPMPGRRQKLPTIDEVEYGIPAGAYLGKDPHAFVLVIDDLESSGRPIAPAVYARYRTALDRTLGGMPGYASRAAIHFLVNMLEAYYYAHAEAVNTAAMRTVLDEDHPTDVENIRHPKNDLKAAWHGFDEVADGRRVLSGLNTHHVLRHPDRCCWLRTLFAWCVEKLVVSGAAYDPTTIRGLFALPDGCRSNVTQGQ